MTANANIPLSDKESEDAKQNFQEEHVKPTKGGFFQKIWSCLCGIYGTHAFLIKIAVAVGIAAAYPPLGAKYLAPQITATWVAVVIIFLLSGLGLKTSEFSKALKRPKFNLFVQVFNFGVVSAAAFGFSRLMESIGILSEISASGMIICACMPITVNMVLVLTKSSNGDEAAALFNAAFGNMTGVFLSPALILLYLGVKTDIDLGKVFFKIGLRVLLPTLIGQLLQKFSPHAVRFRNEYKKHFKTVQEWCLIFIVYTVFCKTFDSDDSPVDLADVFIMLGLQFVLLCSVMTISWFLLQLLFRDEPKLRVMGLFGCTHKSVAIGVPMINAVFDGDSRIGYYTLPLLIWHPMQLVIGSFLAPRLTEFVKREEGKDVSATSGQDNKADPV